jgi:RNA polymerase sigma-70 factor (ECF subfamily)
LVYNWARRAGLQDSDAADIAQNVFKNVARSIEGFRRDRPSDSFRGWLWTITQNQIRDFFRKTNKQPNAIGGTDANVHLQAIAESQIEDRSAASIEDVGYVYRRALTLMKDEFLEQTWQAFWRVAVDGVAPESVAEELGISIWSVYQAKSRILRRLRSEFEGIVEL